MRKTIKLAMVAIALSGAALQPAAADSTYVAEYNDGSAGAVSVTALRDSAGTKSGKGSTASCTYVATQTPDTGLVNIVLAGYAGSGSNTTDQPVATSVQCDLFSSTGLGGRAVGRGSSQAVAASTFTVPAGAYTLCVTSFTAFAESDVPPSKACVQPR